MSYTAEVINSVITKGTVITVRMSHAIEWKVERLYNGNVKVTSYIASTHTPTGQYIYKPNEAKALLGNWFANGAELVNKYF